MKLNNSKIQFSPTDLAHFLMCKHIITLDLDVLNGTKIDKSESDEFTEIILNNGIKHERQYLDLLSQRYSEIVDVDETKAVSKNEATISAIKDDIDVIYQGHISNDTWGGIADFIIKEGNNYKIVDTKLSKKPKATHISQVVIYAILIGEMDLTQPETGEIVSPGETETDFITHKFKINDYIDLVNHK